MDTHSVGVSILKSTYNSAKKDYVAARQFDFAGCRWMLRTTAEKQSGKGLKSLLTCKALIVKDAKNWNCDVKVSWIVEFRLQDSTEVKNSSNSSVRITFGERDHDLTCWKCNTADDCTTRHEENLLNCVGFDDTDECLVKFSITMISFKGITIRAQRANVEFSKPSPFSDVKLATRSSTSAKPCLPSVHFSSRKGSTDNLPKRIKKIRSSTTKNVIFLMRTFPLFLNSRIVSKFPVSLKSAKISFDLDIRNYPW